MIQGPQTYGHIGDIADHGKLRYQKQNKQKKPLALIVKKKNQKQTNKKKKPT